MKILALDDLAICTGDRPNDWYSISNDVHGLPQVQAQMARRAGRQPTLANIERLGRQFSIASYFPHNAREASKAALLTKLASREPLRVLGGDACPTEPLLLLGPWDLYTAGGSWYARDALSPEREAVISGALHVVAGPWAGSRALVAERGTTNLINNPSAETGTAGWFVYGSNTIDRITDQAWVGSYSVKATYQDNIDLCRPNTVATLADGTYTASAWVYIPADWDGGEICIAWNSYSGSSIVERVDSDGVRGRWVRIHTTQLLSGDGDGWLRVQATSAPTAGKYVYIDGFQCEAGSLTSYCDGDQGTGYAWTGTSHASTSTRTETQVSLATQSELISAISPLCLSMWVQMPYDSDGVWPSDSIDNRVFVFGSGGDYVYLAWRPDEMRWRLWSNLTSTALQAADTFTAGDWVHIAITTDGTAWSLYLNGALAGSANLGATPAVTYWALGSNANGGNFTYAEYAVFDSALTPEQVAALHQTRINPRWLNAVCLAANPERYQGVANDYALTALMQVDGDTAWRQRDGDYAGISIYDDEGSVEAVNEGNVAAFPTFLLTPTAAKTTGFTKARWVPVKWNSGNDAARYPIDLSNGGLNLSADAQADGDDIRVYSDGYEIDRWLAGTLVTSVKVWANLDFDPTVSLVLATSIGSSDTSLTLTKSIDDLPNTGIVMIDSEAIVYTERNTLTRTLSGLARGARGTTAASHTASTVVHWIQHDIWIYYGDSSLTAPVVNNNYKPIFNLSTSTNASWVYQEFGQDHGLRAGQWTFSVPFPESRVTDALGGSADPWEEIGLVNDSGAYAGPYSGTARCWLYNPCGISGVAWTNGKAYATNSAAHFTMRTYHYDTGYIYDYTHSFSAPNTWESWSYSASSFVAGTLYTGLHLYGAVAATDYLGYFQAADCTITVASATRPVVVPGAAQNIYQLDCIIENEATGQQLMLATMMALGETLIVDTDARTIILGDGSGRLSAKSLDTVRIEWLPLTPGSNVLTFTDPGTIGLRFEMLWDRRYVE